MVDVIDNGPTPVRGPNTSQVTTGTDSLHGVALATRGRPVDVAVGILIKPDGAVLMAQRPAGKPYAGYWEFPGGKVEAGETVLQALRREFIEELGLQIVSAESWCGIEYVYPHAHVRLHFHVSRDWQGEPQSLENQAFAWQGTVTVAPLLPATIPLFAWLDAVRWPPGSRSPAVSGSATR